MANERFLWLCYRSPSNSTKNKIRQQCQSRCCFKCLPFGRRLCHFLGWYCFNRLLSSGRRVTEDICSDIHNISPARLACGVLSVKKGCRVGYVERAVPPSCKTGSPKELGTEISVPRSRHQILVPGSWYQDLGTKILVPSSCTVLVWLFCAFESNQSCLGRWHTLLSRASFPFRFYSLWPPRHYVRGG